MTQNQLTRVYYPGSFWGRSAQSRPGVALSVGKQFLWEGENWCVPAVYLCGAGLVMDICRRVEAQAIREFLARWADVDEQRMTAADRRRMEAENPLKTRLCAQVVVNGKPLRSEQRCGVSWIPQECLPAGEKSPREAEALLCEYALDPSFGWSIFRVSLPWATRRKPKIRSLSLRLEAGLSDLPGPLFAAPESGESFSFVHPATGQTHRLTVHEYALQTLDAHFLEEEEAACPRHYAMMLYTVAPEIPEGEMTVQDSEDGDNLRTGEAAASIGIIGGADGPTVILLSRPSQDRRRVACSHPRFAAEKPITWQLVFHVRQREDITVDLC